MSQQYLGPYINFQGRAREAMEFYQKVLGGKLDLQTMNERGVPKPAGSGIASHMLSSRPMARALSPRTDTPTSLPKSATTWESRWAALTETGSPKSSTTWPKAANPRCHRRSSPEALAGSRTSSASTGW